MRSRAKKDSGTQTVETTNALLKELAMFDSGCDGESHPTHQQPVP